MFTPSLIGTATRVTGAGTTTITSGNANIIGFLCCNSATATGGVQFFAGVTASTSISGLIVCASGSVAQYFSVPAYASGGFTVKVGTADNPDITLFWNPAGG